MASAVTLMEADMEGRSSTKAPRLYHKKSKSGCQRCRTRKVKCDEAHPVCGSCSRHQVSCQYPAATRLTRHASHSTTHSPTAAAAPSNPSSSTNSPSATSQAESPHHSRLPDPIPIPIPIPTLAPDPASSSDLPESASRRLLELRLLHHYTTTTAGTRPSTHDPANLSLHQRSIPQLAMSYPPLLYSLLSLSALHLSKLAPAAAAAPDAAHLAMQHTRYLDLTLFHHRRALTQTAISAANVDAVCCTSILILINAYAGLQDRQLFAAAEAGAASYQPPSTWMRIAHGTKEVYKLGWEFIEAHDLVGRSVIGALVRSVPVLFNVENNRFVKGNLGAVEGLLRPVEGGGGGGGDSAVGDVGVDAGGQLGRGGWRRRPGADMTEMDIDHEGGGDDQGAGAQAAMDLTDPEDRAAYEMMLSYIGMLSGVVARGEHPLFIARLLSVFAVLSPSRMIELIEEKRPRALAVLAKYFEMGLGLESVWWVGSAPRREIEALRRYLPRQWMELVENSGSDS